MKLNLKFLRDNSQVVYSIALIILIPGVVILNTWLFSTNFRETIDQSLQDKAVGIGESINAGVADKLNSPEEMQVFINNWETYNTDTKSLDIYYRDNDSFKLVATMNNEAKLNQEDNSLVYAIAWNNNWPSAQEVYETEGNVNYRYWLVVMPLTDLTGQKQALLSMKLANNVMDTIIAVVLTKSSWMLGISVFLIILILLVNGRLFEYSILYNKIKEVDAMKDDFISMASHELRTPVTVIRGYATMMLEEADKMGINAEAKENLSIINISSERLNGLVEDLLNVSRIEQGRMKMNVAEMEAWPMIEETVKEMKIQADNKGLALLAVLEPNTKSLIGADKDRLKQVLINIIGNSIKYTPSGSVEVKALNRDNNLVIVVKDTGIGMTAKQREHLFEKFYRVKTKQTEEIVGTGLGLWITKQIIELMKGTIMIDSMENVGTQVTLEFPLIKQ
jgi:signal transduction histidine kinase